MRKLTVKNFSVIKDAELEFGKITVLIGPQSSGKSLLCKLAYFLGKELLISAVNSIMRGDGVDDFANVAIGEFSSRFRPQMPGTTYSVEFEAGDYSVRLFGGTQMLRDADGRAAGDSYLACELSERFREVYSRLLSGNQDELLHGVSKLDKRDGLWTQLNLLLSNPIIAPSLYVPSGRSFFTNTSIGFSALRNPDIDPLISEFGAEIAWGQPWQQPGRVIAGDDVLRGLKKTMGELAGGEVRIIGNVPTFKSFDGRDIPLSRLSSGTQELLPLFNVLGRLAAIQETREVMLGASYDPPRRILPVHSKTLVYVEEPEASTFPSTQYELVRLFARMSYEPNLDFSWVFTTHSPYIMTAFNTLIEAGRVGDLPGRREKVNSLIPEQYWIQESDFKAYAIKDGNLVSIFKPEVDDPESEGMINGDYLDSVSDQLGKEFSQLLDIEFAE